MVDTEWSRAEQHDCFDCRFRKGKTMKAMKAFRTSLLIGLTAVALGAGAAHAEKSDYGSWGGRDHAHSAERMKERMQKRAAELHDKLKLNASQESAWNAYVAKMTPAAMPARPDRAELDKLSAPERMDRMLERMKVREQRMSQRVAATKEFYATLTPEQQKVFDQQFSHRPGRGRIHRQEDTQTAK
jgi:Spy/CpxP family protein refolding chaperone